MRVVKDALTGQLFLLDGNTKLELPRGGGSEPDGPSEGHRFAAMALELSDQERLLSVSHDLIERIPSAWALIPIGRHIPEMDVPWPNVFPDRDNPGGQVDPP